METPLLRLPPPPVVDGTQQVVIQNGVGQRLSRILMSLGFQAECHSCGSTEKQMDAWGTEGCREHKEEIVTALRSKYQDITHWQAAKAMVLAFTTRLFLKVNWLDPIPDLVELAITLTEFDDDRPAR